ncbi:hypothetical protein GCM10023169_01880 [Georgenia halophila]|uniref:Glycosyltransferase subfamily 4-like N-terminal domain-containing protein n=1 Tax=Georgenia halophila TaxID=620889 RepID=A0ABP8KSP3_9MICO
MGGAEGYMARLYGQLRRHGKQAEVLGNLPGWCEGQGHVHREVPLSPKWSRRTIAPGLLKVHGEARRVRALVEDLSPDWIHMQFKREQIGFSRSLAQIAPVIWTEHGVLASRSPLRPAYKLAARHVSTVICVSEPVASSIEGLVPRSRILVIENAVDARQHRPPSTGERQAARAQLGVHDDRHVMLWVGRLDRSKRPELAISYARRHHGDHVVIAGTGRESGAIRSAAQTLQNVTVTGHITDISPLFHAADLLMFTSTGRGEGMPTVIVEAASYGVPVVTHARSGAEEIVRASGGAVVANADDMDEWARTFRASWLQNIEPRRTWLKHHEQGWWVQQHLNVIESL